MGARWTQEEIDMLKNNIPISELARKLGRTEAAVRDKRKKLQIYQVNGIFKPESFTEYEKEARVLKLAKKYGIKLEVKR